VTAVPQIRTAHTADLDAATLKAARTLLDNAFRSFDDHDWDHTLGGIHALAWQATTLVGHGSVVQRRLLYGGRALRTGYVEAVAVHADVRRRGIASMLMAELERIIRGAYELGALSATGDAQALYRGRGWQLWQGPSYALTPAGSQRTEDDDGAIYVFPVAVALDVTRELTCDWRDGDVW
jgi:aminoglycoside 2'-N-acetyltransferase I